MDSVCCGVPLVYLLQIHLLWASLFLLHPPTAHEGQHREVIKPRPLPLGTRGCSHRARQGEGTGRHRTAPTFEEDRPFLSATSKLLKADFIFAIKNTAKVGASGNVYKASFLSEKESFLFLSFLMLLRFFICILHTSH